MSNTNSKHTPLPWKLALKAGTQDMTRIKSEKGQTIADAFWMGEGIEQEEGIANAELIVKAVNCHFDLVDALIEAKEQIIHLQRMRVEDPNKDTSYSTTESLRIINEALKNSEFDV